MLLRSPRLKAPEVPANRTRPMLIHPSYLTLVHVARVRDTVEIDWSCRWLFTVLVPGPPPRARPSSPRRCSYWSCINFTMAKNSSKLVKSSSSRVMLTFCRISSVSACRWRAGLIRHGLLCFKHTKMQSLPQSAPVRPRREPPRARHPRATH